MSTPYAAARRLDEEEKKRAEEEARRVKRYPGPAAPADAVTDEIRIVGGLPPRPTYLGGRRRRGGEIRSDR